MEDRYKKTKEIIKDHIEFEKETFSTFNPIARDNTTFINKQLLMLFLMLVAAGGFNIWIFLKLTREDWLKIYNAGEPLATVLLGAFLILGATYLTVLDIHKHKIKKANAAFYKIVQNSVRFAYNQVEKKQDWNIHTRSVALKKILESEEYKEFLNSKLRKRKYNKAYIGFVVENYCHNHIDNLYHNEYDKIEDNKEKENEKTITN